MVIRLLLNEDFRNRKTRSNSYFRLPLLPLSKFKWLLNQRGLKFCRSYSSTFILARLWESKGAYAKPLDRKMNSESELAFVIEFASSCSSLSASMIRLTYVNLKTPNIYQHEILYLDWYLTKLLALVLTL